MGKYRGRLQIIADMLAVVSENDGARKTKIMYQANLSYKLLRRYLGEIVEAGLVRFGNDDCYVLTEKGQVFLGKCSQYFERRRSVEERFNEVLDEKGILENMFSNANAVEATSSRKGRDGKE